MRKRNKKSIEINSKVKALKKIRPKGSDTKNSFWKRFKTYNNYLKSKEWIEIKKIYFGKRQKKCIGCGSKKRINVHHRSYNRLGSVNETKDLVTVCSDCHVKIHEIEKSKGVSVNKATTIVLGTFKAKRRKKKIKKSVEKTNERLVKLRVLSEIEKKDKLIRDLRLKGINGNFTKLKYLMVLKIHSKYV